MTLLKHTNRQKSFQVLLSSHHTNQSKLLDRSMTTVCSPSVVQTSSFFSSSFCLEQELGPQAGSQLLSLWKKNSQNPLQLCWAAAPVTESSSRTLRNVLVCSASVSAFADKLSPYCLQNPNFNNYNSNNYILKLHEFICDCCSVFSKLELWCLKCWHNLNWINSPLLF